MIISFTWEELADKQKAQLSSSPFLFVAGHRAISSERIIKIAHELSKLKLPIVWGALRDKYIPGLENSPIFLSHGEAALSKTLEGAGELKNITLLSYFQRHWKYIIEQTKPKAAIVLHGSHSRMLHLREEYWLMLRNKIAVKQLSNFNSEIEAANYLKSVSKHLTGFNSFDQEKVYGDKELLELASKASLASWDRTFRAGAVLSQNGKVIATSHNTVLPAEYSMLHKGSRKEKYFSPPQDQNFYDTNHAEMELLITAAAESVKLSECVMHVNLMPCEGCARVLARSGIKKIVYGIEQTQKHSYEILKSSGVDVMLEA